MKNNKTKVFVLNPEQQEHKHNAKKKTQEARKRRKKTLLLITLFIQPLSRDKFTLLDLISSLARRFITTGYASSPIYILLSFISSVILFFFLTLLHRIILSVFKSCSRFQWSRFIVFESGTDFFHVKYIVLFFGELNYMHFFVLISLLIMFILVT